MAIRAPFDRDLPFDQRLVPTRCVQRPGPMAALTSDINPIGGFTNSAEPAGLIKAGAVTANAGVIVGASFVFERRPRFGVGRRLPQRVPASCDRDDFRELLTGNIDRHRRIW